MADKLIFNLVSPERELFSREVDEVTVPGTEGQFGVFANHSAVMATLMPGMLIVRDGSTEAKIFVQGGFADVTPQGLTVLAEFAIPLEELTGDVLAAQKKAAAETLTHVNADEPDQLIAAQRAVEVLGTL